MHRLDSAHPPLTQSTTAEAGAVALDAQLRQAQEHIAELEARDSLKTQFLANISHDLRTPLTAVITHAEILRDGILGSLSPRQLESITGVINRGRQPLAAGGGIPPPPRRGARHPTPTPPPLPPPLRVSPL